MRAILIDPEAQTVTDIDHAGKLEALYETLGCSTVERVPLLHGENLWCDEEGLLKQPHRPLFHIGHSPADPTYIAGKAVIFGEDEAGAIKPTAMELEMVRDKIVFRPHLCLLGWDQLDGSTTMETAFGPMPVFGRVPRFGPRPKPDEE